jgi:2-polyprenyl-3-methyl-5-hydroxy-6-metoxy-1,4-benzoquinol methylase
MNSSNDKGGIEDVYRYHHRNRRARKASMFVDFRGDFLKENIGTGKNVLDIGCRDGALTEKYYEGNDVLGLDIDSEALKIAEEDLKIKTKHTDLNSSWDVEDDVYDFIVAGEVLEHLYYPGVVLKKISAALKPDGVLLGSVPNAFSFKNRLRILFGTKKGTPLSDPTHINHFHIKELKGLLENTFENVEILPLGRFAYLDKFFPGMFTFMLVFKASTKK